MKTRRQRQGFTLIEVLIVVVIMAVLAATIIPQFTSSTEDAKESALKFNLHTLRNQIELYKVHHAGTLPTITAGSLPQLTSSTDATGAVGTGANYPYGPYVLNALPENPYNGLTTVVAATANPPTAEASNAGWQYHAATGRIWANTTQFLGF
jgi:prepilin-type N-terminal cleavage/methylation domain-containing protein